MLQITGGLAGLCFPRNLPDCNLVSVADRRRHSIYDLATGIPYKGCCCAVLYNWVHKSCWLCQSGICSFCRIWDPTIATVSLGGRRECHDVDIQRTTEFGRRSGQTAESGQPTQRVTLPLQDCTTKDKMDILNDKI